MLTTAAYHHRCSSGPVALATNAVPHSSLGVLRPAALVFFAQDWLWPALAVFAVATALVAWSYARSALPGNLRLGCAALKLLGISALLLCFLEPTWTGRRAKPGANVVAIIADNSQSMQLKDRDASQPRGEALRHLLMDEKAGAWRARLTSAFEVRNFLADSRLQGTPDFHGLTFEGRASSLGQNLRQLSERFRGQPLAGIVLLTDGIASDIPEGVDLHGLPPVFPVIFGKDEVARDLAVAAPSVTQTAFEDAPVSVQSDVVAGGFNGEEITARLLPLDGGAKAKPVAEQTLRIPADGSKTVARFQFRPEKSGTLLYRLEVVPKAGGPPEATLANNQTVIAVDRAAGPYRVLYVGGRPNWEYKFLQRALQADGQTELVGLLRIAKREPKFEFRGRAGESSNPLFRGFSDPSKEEVERYDQPVLLRLNTQDERELRGGFPKTAEELFRYHAVVLDDLEAEFFTVEQMGLVRRFVSERGGGFLMLGGAESFAEGNFQRTPIADLLPIYLDRKPDSAPRAGAGPLRLSLTREGWLQPWVRLRPTEEEERRRLGMQPSFDVLNRAGGAKPAASVIATANDGGSERPALVTQRFGRGRSAALLLGDLWHSGLGDEALSHDLGKAWRQMIRWLVADVPAPIEIHTEDRSDGEGVGIQVRVRDREFQPMDNAIVSLTVQAAVAADNTPVAMPVEPSASKPGLYETTYFPRESGGYRVEAAVMDESRVPLGKAHAGWSTDLAGAEFRSLVPNRALMESIARQTGGRLLAPEDLDAFASELPSLRAPVTETWTRPLWHTPWTFLFALGCFVAEWGIRRRKGLA